MFEKNRINSIHFLRFVAAAAVVNHHIITGYGSTFVIGGAGVDVFFVISGIVIGLTMNSPDGPWNFAIKRFIRVLPLYWIATLAYAGLRYWAYKSHPTTEEALRSAFLWPSSGPIWSLIYFPGWSLVYEMLFYIAAAICVVVFRRHARPVCLLIFAALSLARIPIIGANGLHFETEMCLEFCLGMVVSEMIIRRLIPDKKIGTLCLVLALLLFAINQQGSDIPRMVVWGIPSSLLVIGSMAFESAAWFKNRWAVLGGNASYAIYLSHLTTIETLQTLAAKHSIPMAQHPVMASIFLLVAAIPVGVGFHLLVERPVLDVLRSMFLPKRSVAVRTPSTPTPTPTPIMD